MAGPSTNRAESSTLHKVLLVPLAPPDPATFAVRTSAFGASSAPPHHPRTGWLAQERTSTIRADAVRPAEQSRAK